MNKNTLFLALMVGIGTSHSLVAGASGCMGPFLAETKVLSQHQSAEAVLHDIAVTKVLDPRRTRATLSVEFATFPNPNLPKDFVQMHDLGRLGELPHEVDPVRLRTMFLSNYTWVEVVEDHYIDDCDASEKFSRNLRVSLKSKVGALEFRTDYPSVESAH